MSALFFTSMFPCVGNYISLLINFTNLSRLPDNFCKQVCVIRKFQYRLIVLAYCTTISIISFGELPSTPGELFFNFSCRFIKSFFVNVRTY